MKRLLDRVRRDPSLPRFLLVGVSNTAISFGVFMGLLRLLGELPQRAAVAQAIGYAAGIGWSFTWNRRWTFAAGGPWAGQFARFLGSQLVFLALSTAVLHLAVDRAHLPPVPAWVAVMAVITLLNYAVQRRLVFRRAGTAAELDSGAGPATGPQAGAASGLRPVDLLEAVAILATAAGFGLSYGVDDQNTYLLHGLMRVHPSALPGDWLAHETLLYHGTWAWSLLVTACLAWKPASLAIAAGLTTALILWVIRGIVALVVPERRTTALFLLLGFLLVMHSESVGQSRLFCHVLVPQSLSVGLLIGAILLFLRGRTGWSGLLQAAAGYLHAHFLFLGPALMGTAHLLLPRPEGVRPWRTRALGLARQLGPGLLLLAIRLPKLLEISNAPGADEGRRIIIGIRSPHHFLISRYLPEFVPLLGWVVLGGAGLAVLMDAEHPVVRRVAAVQGALVAFLGTSFVAIAILGSLPVTHLYPWRLAPFAVMLSQLLAVAACARVLGGAPIPHRRLAGAALGYVVGAALVLGFLYQRDLRLSKPVLYQVILLGTLGGLPLLRLLLARSGAGRELFRGRVPVALVTGLALVACLWGNRHYMRSRSTILEPLYSESRRELSAWARTTPPAARFLIPPELEEFRLAANHPIVVDWKNAPMDPAGAVEWLRRMRAITGGGAALTARQARDDYGALGVDSLRAIGHRFDCAYVVQRIGGAPTRDTDEGDVARTEASSPAPADTTAAPGSADRPVYENAEYRVWALTPTGGNPDGR